MEKLHKIKISETGNITKSANITDLSNKSKIFFSKVPFTSFKKDFENLYGAGRMISSDDAAFAAVRVMGTCFATGHGAGVAAAWQALHGTAEVAKIQEELRRQGALV